MITAFRVVAGPDAPVYPGAGAAKAATALVDPAAGVPAIPVL